MNLVVYGVLIYFAARLQRTAGQFLYVVLSLVQLHANLMLCLPSVFFLFLVTLSLTMQAWFRTVAAAFKSEATAQSVAGFRSLTLTLL